MTQALALKSYRPREFWLLLALVFFLPLYEAPKNILWAAYVLVWMFNRWRDGDWGGRWDAWDTLIAVWIGSGYVVALFAATHYSEWNGASDTLRYGSILWCIKRSGYSRDDSARLCGVVLLSCTVALGWGFWRFYVTHQRTYVELHSVGHVNHSAPYLAICAELALAWTLAFWRRSGAKLRLLAIATTLFLMTGLVIGASRGGVGAMLVATVVLGVAWWRRSRIPLAVLSLAAVAVVLIAVVTDVGVVEKQRAVMKSGDHLSHRGTIWNRALVAWQAHPWFGVGIDNFGQITDAMVKQQVESRGAVYVQSDYAGSSHAHNLYLNTLAERGLFGFSILALVLVSWVALIWRRRPAPEASDIEWTYWGGNVSSWIIITGAGIVNTTLHHEIAILAMLLLGGWMALVSRRLVATHA